MSIEIEVVPTIKTHFTWQGLIERMRNSCRDVVLREVERIQPIDMSSCSRVALDSWIIPPCRFSLAPQSANSLYAQLNKDSGTSEREDLEAFGSKWDDTTMLNIATMWHAVGWSYFLESFIWRERGDLNLLFLAGLALAEITNGWVINKQDLPEIDIPQGLYSSAEFAECVARLNIEIR